MKPWMNLLNNFCHDLFTGLWFGSFITLWILRDKSATLGADNEWLAELNSFFFTFCILSLVAVSLTGMFRYFYQKNWDESKQESPELKRQMLIIKHAIFGTCFIVGTVLGYLWTH